MSAAWCRPLPSPGRYLPVSLWSNFRKVATHYDLSPSAFQSAWWAATQDPKRAEECYASIARTLP